MKKKWVFAFALMLAIVPCFAEIRVERAGYTDEVGNSVNTACYWNDKYNYLKRSAKELAKQISEYSQGNGARGINGISHYYITPDGNYVVGFAYDSTYFAIQVTFSYPDGYQETLYQNTFYSFNSAKAQFDSLCQKYYNKIPQ